MKPGILVISHGSQEKTWVSRVDDTVAGVRRSLEGAGVPVECGYLELVEGRLIQDGIDRLEERGVTDILAIPLFVSAGSTHVDEIGWALGAYEEPRRETDLERCRASARIRYGRPIADDPEIADVLLEKLAASGLSARPADESLLLIGHGSEEPWFYEEWRRGLEGLAAMMRERGGYAAADAALLRPDQVAERARRLREGAGASVARGTGGADGASESREAGGMDGASGSREAGGMDGASKSRKSESAAVGNESGEGAGADEAAGVIAAEDRPVLAVPVFISEGYFTSTVIPRRLEGTDCRYAASSLIPHPKVEAWIERQAREWLESLSVRNKEGEQVGENQSEANL